MHIPRHLSAGDKIAIVATGRKINPGEIDTAIATMQDWGFKVVLGKHLYADSHSYMAGTDPERQADMQQALDNPEVRAIVCARGGYGTSRILDQLDFTAFKKDPKWVAGFSDITALHVALANLGVASIHGIMPLLFNRKHVASSLESLRAALVGEPKPITAGPNSFNRAGTSTAPLVGGNLSLLTDSLATRYEVDTKGKILLIEEVDEYTYKLDRMLTQLKRAGKLTDLAGLVVGYISSTFTMEVSFTESIEEIVHDKVKGTTFPVAFGFPVGHEIPNEAFCHGASYTLTVSSNGSSLSAASVAS